MGLVAVLMVDPLFLSLEVLLVVVVRSLFFQKVVVLGLLVYLEVGLLVALVFWGLPILKAQLLVCQEPMGVVVLV